MPPSFSEKSGPQRPVRQAFDAAAALRVIADLQMYGLLVGGPTVNLERCDYILEEGRQRGLKPSRPDVEAGGAVHRGNQAARGAHRVFAEKADGSDHQVHDTSRVWRREACWIRAEWIKNSREGFVRPS